MIYITGDTHGSFNRIADFCREKHTTKDNILIILGDAGINYHRGYMDIMKKDFLAELPITLLCVHGNHEQRPFTIPTYTEQEWHGGIVYVENEYPSILFAKDGEVYDLDGQKAIAIGGAYSIDKMFRIMYGYGWWADEQPSDEIKRYVEKQLEKRNWKIDVVLSHTVPLKYEPTEVFLPGVDQSRVDKSTEEWLGKIEEQLQYRKWYCGHYHAEKEVDRVRLMFEEIENFC